MKQLGLLSILLCIATGAKSQSDTVLSYTAVVMVDSNLDKTQLYNRARAWFAESFKDSKEVIQLLEPETGEIIGKASMKYTTSVFMGSSLASGWIRYTVKIQVKDGRYKYTISQFNHEAINSFGIVTSAAKCPEATGSPSIAPLGWRNKVWTDLKETISAQMPAVVSSLTTAMGKPPVKEDW